MSEIQCYLIGLLDLPGWHDKCRRVYSPQSEIERNE